MSPVGKKLAILTWCEIKYWNLGGISAV